MQELQLQRLPPVASTTASPSLTWERCEIFMMWEHTRGSDSLRQQHSQNNCTTDSSHKQNGSHCYEGNVPSIQPLQLWGWINITNRAYRWMISLSTTSDNIIIVDHLSIPLLIILTHSHHITIISTVTGGVIDEDLCTKADWSGAVIHPKHLIIRVQQTDTGVIISRAVGSSTSLQETGNFTPWTK